MGRKVCDLNLIYGIHGVLWYTWRICHSFENYLETEIDDFPGDIQTE